MFFFVSLGIFAIFHIIGFYGLLAPLSARAPLRYKIFCALIVLLNFCLVIFYVLSRRLEWLPSIAVIALSFSILFALLLFFAGFLNIFLLIIFRKFARIKQNIAKILCIFIIFGMCVGIYNAHKMPVVVEQEVEIDGISREFSILLIADLHLSKLISAKKVQKIVELANSTNSDIIVLVGDIIDAPEHLIRDSLDELRALNAREGVYFVLGNHEYIFNAHESARIMREFENITTLINAHTTIDGVINLVGISDLSGIRVHDLEPDLELSTRGLSSLPTVLLSHQPNIINDAQSSGILEDKIDLVLSGHTHGGQVFPFSFFVYLANPFLHGLKTINSTQLYITQGASVAVTYGRLGTQNEINLLKLKPRI